MGGYLQDCLELQLTEEIPPLTPQHFVPAVTSLCLLCCQTTWGLDMQFCPYNCDMVS